MRKITIICPTDWECRSLVQDFGFSGQKGSYASADYPSVEILVFGIGRANAARAAERLSSDSASGDLVILAGFSGALRRELVPGDMLIDSARSDAELSKEFLAIARESRIPAYQAPVVTKDQTLITPRQKEECQKLTGAWAVDMEGEHIYKDLKKKNIRFCAVRFISDTMDQPLPSSLFFFDSTGKITFRFVKNLLKRPGEWRDMWGLMASSRKAEKNLAKVLGTFISNLTQGGQKSEMA